METIPGNLPVPAFAERRDFVVGQRRYDRPSPHFQVERPGDRVNRIPEGFGLQPATIHAPEKSIGWILPQVLLRGVATRLLIRAGKHDQAMQFFDTPTTSNEFGGQPIE